MKNTIITAILLIISIQCKAQNPVLDISEQSMNSLAGAYYKDTQNFLNPFVGTYVYSNGNTSLKIILQKKTMSSKSGFCYQDLIVGEYQYIENGVEKINTLTNLNNFYADGRKHNISGSFVITGKSLGCDECGLTEKRLRVNISDKILQRSGNIDIRKLIVGGQSVIKIDLWWNHYGTGQENEPPPPIPVIPYGMYILIKQ